MSATRVEIADLGDWGAAALLSEYDPEDGAIRIDARALAAVRAARGDAEADRFVACAIAHEAFHEAHPEASEADARAHARAATGSDARVYERIVRDGTRPVRRPDARDAERDPAETP